MKTWREILHVRPDPASSIYKTDDNGDKENNDFGFVAIVADSRSIANAIVDEAGTGTVTTVSVSAGPDCGKSWHSWMAEQCDRIFAEARGSSHFAPEMQDTATTFQRSFFENLADIPAYSETDLLEQACQRGIPSECAKAFWKATHSHRIQSPSKRMDIRNLDEGDEDEETV